MRIVVKLSKITMSIRPLKLPVSQFWFLAQGLLGLQNTGAYVNGELLFAYGLAEGVLLGDAHVLKKHGRQLDFTHGELHLPCTFTASVNRSYGDADILLILWDEYNQLINIEGHSVNVTSGRSLYPVLMPGPGVTVEMH